MDILSIFFAASFLFCSLNQSEAQLTATISPDRDYIAPLDVNSVVQFNCTATGTIIEWTVDGTSAKHPTIRSRGVTASPEEDIGGGVFFSSLFIRASKENDNTSIRCSTIRIVNINLEVFQSGSSKLIFLNIQKVSGPPPKLLGLSKSFTRMLSWNAPETLDLTDIEPDVLYYTVCHNLTGVMNCTNKSSIGERAVKFEFSNVSVTLLSTVTAVNVIGDGDVSSKIYLPSGSLTIETTTTTLPGSVPTPGRVSNRSSGIGTVIGGILFGVIFIVVALLIAIVVVLCWQYKKKSSKVLKKQSTMHLLERIEMDGGRENTSIPENFYETITTTLSEEKVSPTDTSEFEGTSGHKLDTAKQQDSPTSLLYTEVVVKDNSKDKRKLEFEGLAQAQKGLNCDEEGVSEQNFTKEVLDQLSLSKEEEVSVLPID